MPYKEDPKKYPDTWFVTYKRNIEKLVELFPETFNKEFPLPLMLGTHHYIQKVTGWSNWKVHAVMAVWTSRMEYVMMACSVGKRYDLNGNAVGPISDDNQSYYSLKLNCFRSKSRIKQFCIDYKNNFGSPALIFVPVKLRPNLGEF